MSTLQIADILPIAEYEQQRDKRRTAAMALRARRQLQLGDKIALHFENRDTLVYQVQEMMRVEHMTSVDAILEELEVYNELMPDKGVLSATLFIQLTSDEELRKWLPIFTHLEGNLVFDIGGQKILAEFEPGRTREDKTASVHYIKFRLNEAQVNALKVAPAEFAVTLKEYNVRAPISDALRKELLADLA